MNSRENFICNDVFFRGFDSMYGAFSSYKTQSYTWLTDDAEYALDYANHNGKIAIVKIKNANIGNIYDLEESTDIYESSENDMESLYKNGFDGYAFYVNNNNSLCICIKKDVLQLITCMSVEAFKENYNNRNL